MTKTLEQRVRAYRVLDHIERNPHKHDQASWVNSTRRETAETMMNECGTTACFAGWTGLLAGAEYNGVGSWMMTNGQTYRAAALGSALLGLTEAEEDALFYDAQDIADVRKAVFEIFGPRPDGAL